MCVDVASLIHQGRGLICGASIGSHKFCVVPTAARMVKEQRKRAKELPAARGVRSSPVARRKFWRLGSRLRPEGWLPVRDTNPGLNGESAVFEPQPYRKHGRAFVRTYSHGTPIKVTVDRVDDYEILTLPRLRTTPTLGQGQPALEVIQGNVEVVHSGLESLSDRVAQLALHARSSFKTAGHDSTLLNASQSELGDGTSMGEPTLWSGSATLLAQQMQEQAEAVIGRPDAVVQSFLSRVFPLTVQEPLFSVANFVSADWPSLQLTLASLRGSGPNAPATSTKPGHQRASGSVACGVRRWRDGDFGGKSLTQC